MRYLLNISAAAIGSASVAAFASGAVAQEVTYTMTCQDVGAGTPEALGDREGHTLAIYSGSCRTDSGPLSGAITTGTDIFEWNGPNAVLVTGNGVARKPGATLVYQNTGGKMSLTMTDGKVTGWTASGKGTNLVATGHCGVAGRKVVHLDGKTHWPRAIYVRSHAGVASHRARDRL